MPQFTTKKSLEQIFADQVLPSRFFTKLPGAFSSATSLTGAGCEQQRVFWFPSGVPAGNSVFLASSRLDQKLEDKPTWFDALRTFACRINSNKSFLITADRIASDEFVTRIAELFQISLVRFLPLPPQVDEKWIRETATTRLNEFRCYYSVSDIERGNKKTAQAAKDRLLILAANQVRVIACRNSGNTFDAVNQRLATGLDTRVLISDELTPPKTVKHFVKAGATAWLLFKDKPEQTHKTASRVDIPLLQLDEINSQQYLLHWTRRRIGKWPDQTKSQYIDDLIFGSTRAKHDPLAALCRILATDRIVATNCLTRDPTPVVCLSEVELSQLRKMTIFRPHLSRWDFLPYGIAVDRELLTSLGARRVMYGSQSDWVVIKPAERPFFQMAKSESGKIDWRQEKEWRLVGDLDLKQVGSKEAIVFVPSLHDAQVVSSISRWPVVVLASSPAS